MKRLRGKSDSAFISIGQLLLALFGVSLIIGVITIMLVTNHLREKTINDLAAEDARQISGLIFQSLFSAMSKGWDKKEIKKVIARLNKSAKDMEIKVYRGFPVIRQFGEIEGEKEIREADSHIMRALVTGEEGLITQGNDIRYIYPVKVERICLKCHTKAHLGEINGVIDILLPIQNMKISLGYIIKLTIAYFIISLSVIFGVLYLLLQLFIARPIVNLAIVMQEIIRHMDLSKQISSKGGWVKELGSLTRHFNKMLVVLKDYSEQLEELSLRDPLTRLYNRRKFEEFLSYEVYRSERHKHEFAVIMLDIDNFKHINDTFGHPVGDLALKEAGIIMSEHTRNTDIVARIGGDEFAIIMPETGIEDAKMVGEKLRSELCTTAIEAGDENIRLTASFGVAEYPKDGQTKEDMAIAMDVAMYKAKRMGKNKVATVDATEKEMVEETLGAGKLIRNALHEDRVDILLQPIVHLQQDGVYGYEVLACVRDGDSIINAGQFIDAANELGLLKELDARVFQKGLDIKQSMAKLEGKKLFFNLSSNTFRDYDLMNGIPDRLEKMGIPISEIIMEITEREALPHLKSLSNLINDLRSKGLNFALDDFGSGFSSFMYLKYLTVDYIKIEGSFVRHLSSEPTDRILVEHINGIAHDFGIRAVAEFVEDEETNVILREMGVNYGQGYHYSMPKSPENI